MTLPAALPFAGAALRVMRAVAGRRALHLALLVGGLFALGILCEGQAHAADGAPTALASPAAPGMRASTPRPVEGTAPPFARTVNSGAGQAVKRSPEATDHRGRPMSWSGRLPRVEFPELSSGRRAASPSVQRGGEPGGRPMPTAPGIPAGPVTSATGKVTAVSGTVREVVRSVADGLAGPAGAPAQQWPTLPSLQSLLTLPPLSGLGLPGLPGVPDLLPGVPGLPGLPGLPGVPTPPVHTLPTPSAPHPTGGGTEHRTTTVEQRETGAHGPQVSGTDVPAGEYGHRAAHGAQLTQAPPYRAPDGDPTHLFGDQSLADGGTPRHGGGQAVALNHRAPIRLVAGAAAVHAADGTRDRHRDIPEFPG